MKTTRGTEKKPEPPDETPGSVALISNHLNGVEKSTRERSLLRTVTQETKHRIIQNIQGHPQKSITMKELNHMIPSKSKSTIREHVQNLVDAGILTEEKLPDGERQNDHPYVFYRITEEGKKFLDNHNLLEGKDKLEELYERVEKPKDVIKYQQAKRPR